jgi:hypothetical protein
MRPKHRPELLLAVAANDRVGNSPSETSNLTETDDTF